MGLKDSAAKNFFGRPEVLADLVDGILFNGKRIARNSRIIDLCGEHPRIVKGDDGNYKTDNRFRDKLFEIESGDDVVMIGVEYQSKNEKKMIQRIMVYNARLYSKMHNDGRMHRIVNIVISFDKNGKKCPSELKQMFDGQMSRYDSFCFNYGFISLNIYELAEKLEIFTCNELKNVLYLFKCAKENRPFMKDIASGRLKSLRRMSRDAALVCIIYLGLKLDIEDDKEEIDMCKEFRDYTRKCKKEGERLGFKKGERLGIEKGERLGIEKGERLGIEKGERLGIEKGERLGIEKGERLGIEKGERLGIEKGERLGIEKGERLGFKKGEKNAIRRMVSNLIKKSYTVLEICNLMDVSEEDVNEAILSLGQ